MYIITDLNIFDFLVLAIIILSAISGFNQGLINSVGKLIAMAVGVVVAIMLYENLVIYLQENYGLITFLSDLIRNKMPLAVSTMDANMVISGMRFEDTAYYLAYLIMIAIAFLILFMLTNQVVAMLWSGLNQVFSHGFLSLINRFSGMLLIAARNLLIFSIILGLIYPILTLASNIGPYSAGPILKSMNESLAAGYMLEGYNYLKFKLFSLL